MDVPFIAFRDKNLKKSGHSRSWIFYLRTPPKSAFTDPVSLTLRYCVSQGWLKRILHPTNLSSSPIGAGNSVRSTAAAQTSVRSTVVFVVQLSEFLQPATIQSRAVELNVQLIKWRQLPALRLDPLFRLRVLLVGAGTLGCSVARNLLGWGVRHITFLDCSRVALSNPVRQSLYIHQDATSHEGAGRFKAEAARDRLLEIRPDANCTAVCLEVPMPGHPRFAEDDVSQLESTLNRLEDLLDNHDVVMLLTDSRESRWLLSLLCSYRNHRLDGTPPLCMCVALGFDSLVVVRHAYRGGDPLACYFCNDVTGPTDTIANRTLDQQCTVTRPGLSGISASLSVELLATLTQHPLGFAAPHNMQTCGGSCLGPTPHTIRASLSDFRIICVGTESFQNCICCSESIMHEYGKDPLGFVIKALKEPAYLERVSGLLDMKMCVNEANILCFSEDEDAA